jgi:predicted DNA-binding ribbon-helix-helix protein
MPARIPKKPAKVGKAGSGVVTSVRFDTHVRAALDKAAKEDKRPTSSLIQKVMEDWLKAKGYLK